MIVVVVLMFYGPSSHFRSFRARSVNSATLFLGKPPRQFTRDLVMKQFLRPFSLFQEGQLSVTVKEWALSTGKTAMFYSIYFVISTT